jgi:HEAT repeat protein
MSSFVCADDAMIDDLSKDGWESRFMNQHKLETLKSDLNFKKLIWIADNGGLDWRIRIRAIKVLGEMRYYNAMPYIIAMFNDPFFNNECPSIKSYVATALGNYTDYTVVEALIGGIDDAEILVREEAVKSLGKIGDKRAVSYLINALNDKSFAVRAAVIRSLAQIGDVSAISHLRDIVNGNDDSLIKREASIAIDILTKQRR